MAGFESDTPQADRMPSPELQKVLQDALTKQRHRSDRISFMAPEMFGLMA